MPTVTLHLVSKILLGVSAISCPQNNEFTLKALPNLVVAEHERVGNYLDLQSGFALPTAWITRHGWQPTGPGVAIFHDKKARVPNFDKRRRATLQLPLNVYGTVLPDVDSGPEATKLSRTKPSLVLTTTHFGEMRDIGTTYEALFTELKKRNLKYEGFSREIYRGEKGIEVQLVVAPKDKVAVGIYADQGVNPDGILALSLCLADANINFTAISSEDINNNSFSKKVDSLLMPGGWAEQYAQQINDKGGSRIEDFVEGGGGYIGICAGAFYSAKEIEWGGKKIPYDIDLFPGIPAPPGFNLPVWPGYSMASLDINKKHLLAKTLSENIQALYYGGPKLAAKDNSSVDVLASFNRSDEPAIVSFNKEKGRVFLSAVHLEYDLNSMRDGSAWPELESGFTDTETDWLLLQSAIRWAAKQNTE